ncbi:MAG: sigma-70 family RNA polymerase sigma factor [Chitinophagaceae bacterium]|nr:sigma-70 family RNA polymerase sigma factor [Chitinophagaceae bacterium]
MESLTDWFTRSPERSLKRIYEDNYPWLENFIRQRAGNDADAGDIFQEALAAAWINLRERRFNGGPEQFNAYLRQICKYKWISQLRSSTRRKMIYNEKLLQQEIADCDHGSLETALQQTDWLKQSFEKLGKKCREVLGLFYYQGKPMSDIAVKMGNTEESIKTIKYRCMMQLRKHFLEEMKKNGAL